MRPSKREAICVDRREFTLEAALAMLGGVAITISACGGGGYEPSGPTAGQATPTPAPTPTPTPTPEATPSPSPTPEATPSPTPTPNPTPTPSPTPSPVSDKTGSITSNHGHAARITAAQLTAGGTLQLDITGSASHPHTVQLSAGEVMDVAENRRVSKESSTDAAHSHTVTFN
jgi:outer membrane biosynthesis protein TonB